MNKYIFYCNNCSFKKLISNSEDLAGFKFVKSSPIQVGIPKIDHSTGIIKESTNVNQPKRLKCPKCGFTCRPKVLKEEEEKEGEKQ